MVRYSDEVGAEGGGADVFMNGGGGVPFQELINGTSAPTFNLTSAYINAWFYFALVFNIDALGAGTIEVYMRLEGATSFTANTLTLVGSLPSNNGLFLFSDRGGSILGSGCRVASPATYDVALTAAQLMADSGQSAPTLVGHVHSGVASRGSPTIGADCTGHGHSWTVGSGFSTVASEPSPFTASSDASTLLADPTVAPSKLVGASGNGRALFAVITGAGVSAGVSGTPTFNGTNGTKLTSQLTGTNVVEVWWWNDAALPSSAGTYSASITVDGVTGTAAATLHYFEGMSQSAPTNFGVATSTSTSITANLAANATAGSVMVGALIDLTTTDTPVDGSNQFPVSSVNGTTTGNTHKHASSVKYVVTSGANSMSWSSLTNTSAKIALVVELMAPAGASQQAYPRQRPPFEMVFETAPQRKRPVSFSAIAQSDAATQMPPTRRRSMPQEWCPPEQVQRRLVSSAILPVPDSPPGVLWGVFEELRIETMPQRRLVSPALFASAQIFLFPVGSRSSERSGASVLQGLLAPSGSRSGAASGACTPALALALVGCRSNERSGAASPTPALALAGSKPQARSGICVATPTIIGVGCRSNERAGANQTNASLSTVGSRSCERGGAPALATTIVAFPSGSSTGERHGATTLGVALTLVGSRSDQRGGPVTPTPLVQPTGARTGARSGAPAGSPTLALAGSKSPSRSGPAVFTGIACSPVGSRSCEHSGIASTSTSLFVAPVGARSGERSGAVVLSGITLNPTGSRSGAAAGPVALSATIVVFPTGGRSGARSGVATLVATLAPAGSRSWEARGLPALTFTISQVGSRSEQRSGAPSAVATIVVFPTGTRSDERHGLVVLAPTLGPTGSASGSRAGANFIGVALRPVGSRPAEQHGPVVATVLITVSPVGSRSDERHGVSTLLNTTTTHGPFRLVAIEDATDGFTFFSIEDA